VDGLTIEVIFMLMGNEDNVGLGEGRIVGFWLKPHTYRIHLNLYTIVVDLHTGMLDAGDGYFFATLGGKFIHFLGSLTTHGHKPCKGHTENKQNTFLHLCLLLNR
jgi:hypothetical protein